MPALLSKSPRGTLCLRWGLRCFRDTIIRVSITVLEAHIVDHLGKCRIRSWRIWTWIQHVRRSKCFWRKHRNALGARRPLWDDLPGRRDWKWRSRSVGGIDVPFRRPSGEETPDARSGTMKYRSAAYGISGWTITAQEV